MENLSFNPFVLAIVSFLILQLLFMTIGKFSVEKWQNLSIARHPNLYVLIIFVGLPFFGSYFLSKTLINSTSNTRNSTNSSNLGVKECTGAGNQSCIEKVRQNFNNTGKTILGEEYLGDGGFGISFMDSQHPGTYNATISTDCKCNITSSNVSTIR